MTTEGEQQEAVCGTCGHAEADHLWRGAAYTRGACYAPYCACPAMLGPQSHLTGIFEAIPASVVPSDDERCGWTDDNFRPPCLQARERHCGISGHLWRDPTCPLLHHEYAPPTPSQDAMWDALIAEFIEWTMATFPHQTARSAMLHALREQRELADKFEATGEIDYEEAVDCFMLYLASAHSGGVDFKAAFAAKLAKNKAREWGKPDADGVVEHVRETKIAGHLLQDFIETGGLG